MVHSGTEAHPQEKQATTDRKLRVFIPSSSSEKRRLAANGMKFPHKPWATGF